MDTAKPPQKTLPQRPSLAPTVPRQDSPSLRNREPGTLRGKWRSFRSSTSASGVFSGASPPLGGRTGLTLLHEPSDPRIDLIFVHGLRGGSRKTWCYDPDDASTFWPQEWLPYEPGFKNVRIHSFGYDSDWSQRQESPLTILDFSQALLSDILTSPRLGKSQTPVVFVAHSMGGLVVKKAYLQARSDQLYTKIAERTESIFFLGTCHRGSNATVYLETFLSLNLLWKTKAYVRELLPDSQTVREINAEFRHVCESVNLWSFWESKTTAGVFIVEKFSAVLDVPKEHIHYLPADHRHLCKFATPDDPSYVILRQSLLSTVSEIESVDASRQKANYADDMLLISTALGVAEAPTREFSDAVSKIHRGSCTWLTESDVFRDWVSFAGDTDDNGDNPSETNPDQLTRLIWLNGPPGTGKSVSASHIIQFLQQHNLDCSYFFIKSNAVAPLTQLLLSLAFQMAESNYAARQACLAVIKKGTTGLEDPNVIWNSLFFTRIFKPAFCQPHFWVIDGLDELPSRPLSSLIQMLAKIEASTPLRIFITSRPHVPIQLRFHEEGINLSEMHTGQSDSMSDIAAFVDSKFKLRLDDAQREELIPSIVRRSRGNFLWASLVIDRLETAYSVEDMKDALQQVPSEMIGVYGKILDKIKASPSTALAECILEWVVCAPRPLRTEELRKIVFLDIKQTLVARSTAPDAIFTEICGNFITVDTQGCVQLMHQTAKEFLTSEDSGFYVDKRAAHESHAAVCLTHLNAEKSSSGPSRRRPVSSAPSRQDDTVFNEYARANFSYHLSHSHFPSPNLLNLLGAFFSGSVLTWVERVAQTGKLGPILTAVQNLRPYLTRQLDRSPPSDSQHNRLKEWLNDLTRLVTIFGPNLIDSPASIHVMIPSLCPTSSMIHQAFSKRSKSRVICSSNEQWDERVANLHFPSATKDVSVSDQYVAIGLGNGTVRVFNQATVENVATLTHGKPLSKVAFGSITNILSSCSYNLLILWDTNFRERWRATVPGVMGLCFSPDDSLVFVAVRDAERTVIAFQTSDGSEVAAFSTLGYGFDSDTDSDGNTPGPKRYVPEVVRLSPALGLAALAYRMSHVTISTFDEQDGLNKITTFKKTGCEHLTHAPQALDIVFSPAIDSDLMAVCYQDGDIVTVEIDDWSARQRNSYKLHASVLASSPDGRTLAAGDNEGGVCLFTFDTLIILHRISALEEGVRRIFFASNSLRLFDIRTQSCNVWEPPALVRHNSMDDNTTDSTEPDSQASVAVPNILVPRPFEYSKAIAAMTTGGGDEFILCGHEDGYMVVHNLKKSRVVLRARLHDAGVRHLAWDSYHGVLLSADFHGSWATRRFTLSPSGPSSSNETLMQIKANNPVLQVLIREKSLGFSALLTTTKGEEFVQGGKVVASSYAQDTASWIQHPTDANRLLLVENDRINLFHWDGLQRETPDPGIPFTVTGEKTNAPPRNVWHSRQGFEFLFQTELTQKGTKTRFIALDVSRIFPSTPEVSAVVTTLDIHVKHILKIHRSTVYFLGCNSWICSLPVSEVVLVKEEINLAKMKRLRLAVDPEEERMRSVLGAERKDRLLDPERQSHLGVHCSGRSGSATPSGTFYTRHFFIPPYWRTPEEPIVEIVPEKNCVGLAYGDELIVFTRFLDDGDKVGFSSSGGNQFSDLDAWK